MNFPLCVDALDSAVASQLVPLLNVLWVGETLKGKLAKDGKLKIRALVTAGVKSGGSIVYRLSSVRF